MNLNDTPEGILSEAAFSRPNGPKTDPIYEQWALEEGMAKAGEEAFRKSIQSAKESGSEAGTNYGQTLIKHRLEPVATGIVTWLESVNTGKPGRRHTAARLLQGIAPETAAFLALRGVIDGISESRPFAKVALNIGKMVEDEARLSALRETERKAFQRIVEGSQSRVSYHFKRVYAIRIAKEHDNWTAWSDGDRLQLGTKLLDILMETTGIIETNMTLEGKHRSSLTLQATDELLEWIEKRTDAVALMRPRFEPMVVPPRPWNGPYGGGYLSSYIPPLSLVKSNNKAYLEDLVAAEMPIVYAAVNAVQNTAWQVNTEVLSVMQALWDESSEDAGLPSRTGVALPEKPHDIAENAEARRNWRSLAAQVYHRNLSSRGSRIAISGIMSVAERYKKYERIYFPHQYDFRGRMYAVTTLSPQGADYTKGLLRFAEGKPLGETGGSWLAYQGANLAGNDKVSLGDRVQWVLDNEEAILRCADDPLTNREWCGELGGVEIDSPWQFLAFCFEWKGYCEQGDDFVSRLPVAMDGSCSGIQHFSAMLKDPIGGVAVNLVPMDLPQDVYRIVADKVNAHLALDSEQGTEDKLEHTKDGKAFVRTGSKTFAQQWLEFGVTRKVTKRSVMTLAYGSKEFGFKQQLMEDIIGPARSQATAPDGTVDVHVFPFDGDGYNAAGYMAKLIWQAVTVTLVAATNAMKWLQKMATLVAQENLPVRWTTPVGFPVMQAYHDVKTAQIRAVLAGRTFMPRVAHIQETLDAGKMANGISPNFVHSCDASHLTLTVAMGVEEGITNFAMIHDSFGTTAADLEVFFRVVREAFVRIYTALDVLKNFKEEVTQVLGSAALKDIPELPPTGTLDVSQVAQSAYCFA